MSGGGGGGGDAFAEEPEAHENHERYLLTYADMITLLMALFIILFAIGQTDIAKFKRFQTGLQKQFGAPALDGGTGPLEGSQLSDSNPYVISLDTTDPGIIDPSTLQGPGEGGGSGSGASGATGDKKSTITYANADKTQGTIAQVLAEAGLPAGSFDVDVDDRGVVIRLKTDGATFAKGSTSITPTMDQALAVVARAVEATTNRVIVEGHTDDTGGQAVNWPLSGNRAAVVVQYLENTFKIPAARLQLAGYADTRPLVPNTSEENRARNRRVEIVLAIDQSGFSNVHPDLNNPAAPSPIDVAQVVTAAKKPSGSTPTTSVASK